ncbi:MAG: ABC transporter ATP-binding protein [Burkholderiales bacterium]|nr:ABC transporter ATP-binding protein [Burkholderiales bacterium]
MPANSSSVLQLEHVSAYYGKLKVLHDVSLAVRPGERVGVFGHNGAGKTTLLKSCVGEIRAMEGSVRYADEAVLPGQVYRNTRRGIGFVAQGHNVFRDLSVGQNLRIAGLMHGDTQRESVYGIFPVLKQRRNQKAGSLSGGQQQMLALGMALMSRPTILLLDEPSTGLAPIVVRDVLACIRDVNERDGTSIVVVEQNVQATIREVERAIILKSGRVVFDGPSGELTRQESLWHLF